MYIAITSKGYPSRFIYSSPDGATRGVLGVLKKELLERFADAALTCPANGLSSKAGPILKSLCDEFNDLKAIDKIASVQSKVDAVTGVMQKNIEAALKNTDRIEVRPTSQHNLSTCAGARLIHGAAFAERNAQRTQHCANTHSRAPRAPRPSFHPTAGH